MQQVLLSWSKICSGIGANKFKNRVIRGNFNPRYHSIGDVLIEIFQSKKKCYSTTGIIMTMTMKSLYFDIIQKQHYYIKYKQICVNIMSWISY